MERSRVMRILYDSSTLLDSGGTELEKLKRSEREWETCYRQRQAIIFFLLTTLYVKALIDIR